MANATIDIEIRALDKASRKLDAMSKSLNPLKGKVNKLGKEFDDVDRSIKRTQGSFGKLKGLLAGALTVGGITAFSNSVKDAYGASQDMKVALETVTGSAAEADKAFKFIRDFTESTPFQVEQVNTAFVKLKNAGLEPTAELMTVLGDAASVSTDKVGALEAVTDLYSRTVQGGLGVEELDRLQDRGIPVYDILLEKLGKSRSEMSEFGKTAENVAKVREALTAGFAERFGGGMERASETLNGRISTLKDTMDGFLITIGEAGFGDALQNAIEKLTNFLKTNEDLALMIGEKLGQAITLATDGIIFLFENADKAKPIFDLLGMVFNDVIVPALGFMFDAAVKLSEILKPIIEELIPVGVTIFESLGSILQNYVVPAFEKIIEVAKNVTEIVGGMITSVLEGVQALKDFVGASKEAAAAGFNKAKDAIGGAADAVLDFGGGVATSVGDGLSDAGNAVQAFAEDGLKWLGWMEDEAVANSIVPDMVNAIGDWMGKLQDILSNPVAIGVDQSLASMNMMSDGAIRLGEMLSVVGDQASVMTDRLGAMSAMATLSAQSLEKVNLQSLNRLQDRGIPVYQEIQDKLGIRRTEINAFAASEAGSATIRDLVSNMSRSTSTPINSNTNFNISGVTVNNGDRLNSPEATRYIEGVATRIAYNVLRQNTRFGGF